MRRKKSTRYSITSSAIASSVGDTVRLSAFRFKRLRFKIDDKFELGRL
jgi:hypothetical protein